MTPAIKKQYEELKTNISVPCSKRAKNWVTWRFFVSEDVNYAIYKVVEEVWLFKEGTTCLISKDSKIDREWSLGVWAKILKSSYEKEILHFAQWSRILEKSFLFNPFLLLPSLYVWNLLFRLMSVRHSKFANHNWLCQSKAWLIRFFSLTLHSFF